QAAVFRGGFTLEAAEAVIELPAGSPPVLDVLQSLREKSLLRCDEAADIPGELRFGLLETVRGYAEEQLDADAGAQLTRGRHADSSLARGAEGAAGVDGPLGLGCVRPLSLDPANLREVHRRALAEIPPTKDSVTRALRAVLALEPLFYTRGPMQE